MTDDSNTINIRSIQHYLYCPRRFALQEINIDWSENAFVVQADILHANVHDGSHEFSDRNKIVRSAVTVYNDEYDIFGITDCVEFIRSDGGVPIKCHKGNFKVNIVEYKPTAPKNGTLRETDVIQVFAQKLCADYVWKCNSDAFIYYFDTKKRVKLPFDTEFEKYDALLRKLLLEMKKLVISQKIPPRKKGQKCSGCSMSEICFPKDTKYNVREQILLTEEGE